MKHYFHFKKGQAVPQWLMRQRDSETMDIIKVAVFNVNGKVMIDDHTGEAIIWPASKRGKCIVYINGKGLSIRVDTNDERSMNWFLPYRHISEFSIFKKGKKIAPLVAARIGNVKIYSTTRCKPIPEEFQRIATVQI